MGNPAQVLLVERRQFLAGSGATLALAACGQGTHDAPGQREEQREGQHEVPEGRVVARDHEAFFLWAGVAAPDWLGSAQTLYLLAGELGHRPGSRFMPLRAVPRPVTSQEGPEIWATVRLERLDLEEAQLRTILRLPERWSAAGNRVVGLQIDFDSATRGLSGYAAFLKQVRERLPRRWKLSVTGLLDWSAGGDPRALASLAGVIDEIVVQTYQGRHTIPGYEKYLGALPRLGLPYRVGLVENGEWQAPEGLARDPLYRGTVVFLLRR